MCVNVSAKAAVNSSELRTTDRHANKKTPL